LELVLVEACHRLWWKISDPLGVEPSHCLWIKVADLLGIESTERGGVEGLDVTGLELPELIWIDLADGASTAWWWAWADRTRLTRNSRLTTWWWVHRRRVHGRRIYRFCMVHPIT
jgi:hypothetical protein